MAQMLPALMAAAYSAADTSSSGTSGVTRIGIFGPTRYVRTTGTTTVDVPAWVKPYTLQVQNGGPDGTYRVSSATIAVNGTEVVRQSDLNQNVPSLSRRPS